VPNRNGGSCHPGQSHSLVKKDEVASEFLKLWQDSFPTQPSDRLVAREAGVGKKFAGKVIKELLETGELLDPELTRPNQKESGCFVGVGSRALTLEEEVFLLALRTEIPNRPNLSYIQELDGRHGAKVSSAFITQWFKKRFDHPGTFRKPNLVPLDKFRTENLVRCYDFCGIIDKHPDKTVFNFLDEKQIVNKDALPSKIRADPTNGFMDFIPVSGDFRDAFNLFAAVSANPDKPHPVEWTIGRENGDSHSFVAFMCHLITTGFIRHNEVVTMDNARMHTGGVADVVADVLWNTVVDGRALHVLAMHLPTRSPELNPTELVFHILARRIQSFKHQEAGPSADLVLHQANKVSCNVDQAPILRCFVHCGC
jgi:hypothetical protein